MKTILNVLLISALCAVQVMAQSGRAGAAIKVVAPSILPDVLEVYMPLSPLPKEDPSSYSGKWEKLSLNSYDFGDWKKVRVGDTKILRFFAEPSATSMELGKVRLQSSTEKQLLFFMGNHETKRYRVFSLKNSEVEWGEYGVFNSCSSPLRFELGKTVKVAKPNALTVLVPPSEIFEMKVFAKFNGKVRKVSHAKWRTSDRYKEFVFCLQRPNSTRIKWVHVRDRKTVKTSANLR